MGENIKSLYEKKRETIIDNYSKKGRLTLLGKWELGKLFMEYNPDKNIKKEDYDV